MIVSFLSACHYWLLRDLLLQLMKVKFKNSHLQEINDRLQVKLGEIDANVQNLIRKCLNSDKISKIFPGTEVENGPLEYSNIRQCLAKQFEHSKTLLGEKIMIESEISVSNEHIKSLSDKLVALESGLNETNQIIAILRKMLANHQEFGLKIKEFPPENSCEEEKKVTSVVDALYQYENDMLYLLRETNFNVETLVGSNMAEVRSNVNQNSREKREGIATNDTRQPWPVKIELSRQVLCAVVEDVFTGDSSIDSDYNSFDMLNDEFKMLSSLRMTLVQYKEQLERANRVFKSAEHFSDEITLSYVGCLNDAISLLAASINKAIQCQNQFNDTFEYFRKQNSTLKNENKTLILKNEQLQLRVGKYPTDTPIDIAEKLCFLEEQLRIERLSGSKRKKRIQDLERLRYEHRRGSKCYKCGRCSIGMSVSSEMNRQHLASEALNLERNAIRNRQRNTNPNKDAIRENNLTWQHSKRITPGKLSTSGDDIHPSGSLAAIEQLVRVDNGVMLEDRDDRSVPPRHKLSSTHHASNLDINEIIENSWLETNSTMEERRASVFAQSVDFPVITDPVDVNIPSLHQPITARDIHSDLDRRRCRNTSSSRSSSNDTSDTTSIDVKYERRKLAKELERSSLRLQARSPIPFGMSNESVTPTVNDEEQTKARQSSVSEPIFGLLETVPNSPISAVDEFSATESVFMETSPISRRSSTNRPSVIFNPGDQFIMNPSDPRLSVPTISVVEVMPNDNCETITRYSLESFGNNDHLETSDENVPSTLTSRSRYSSRASSIADGDLKLSRRPKKDNPRGRRLYTVAGIGAVNNSASIQEDNVTNCPLIPFLDNTSDIQVGIDGMKDMKQLLGNIGTEDLESKFKEVGFICSTDQVTLVDRAYDANRRCNKTFANVDQEFNILRHLIKSVAQHVDSSSDFLPRIRTSVNVLEKCVENLSNKSEQLGAVKQEMKMSVIIDVMNKYYDFLEKQKSEMLRELNETKLWRESLTEMVSSGSCDIARLKRMINSGRDAKSRFQSLVQSTATKASVLRQLTTNASSASGQMSSIQDYHDWLAYSHSVHKTPVRRSGSILAIDCVDSSIKCLEMENAKIRKYASSRFFPGGNSLDENGENLFHKGLQQGMRAIYDQTLTDLKSEQNKLSVALETLNEMIKDELPPPQTQSLWTNIFPPRNDFMKRGVVTCWRRLRDALITLSVIVVGFLVSVAVIIPVLLAPPKTLLSRKSRRKVISKFESKEKSSSSESLSPDYMPNVSLKHRPSSNL